MHSYTFEAIGTKWVIDIEHSLSEQDVTLLGKRLRQRIEVFDRTFSRFRKDSLVSILKENPGIYEMPKEGISMLRMYKKLYDISDGLVTPLIGSLMEETGYDGDYSLTPQAIHPVKTWEECLTLHETSLEVHIPVTLDFGALGKGMLVDQLGELLISENITSFCLDAGGDILYKNPSGKKLVIGLEHPTDTAKVIGVVPIWNESIASSAGNRRKWGDYHHLMNPKSAKPAISVTSTWIIAENAMLADALATATFFVKPEMLKQYFTFSYLLLYPDFTIQKSDDFPGELYYTNQ